MHCSVGYSTGSSSNSDDSSSAGSAVVSGLCRLLWQLQLSNVVLLWPTACAGHLEHCCGIGNGMAGSGWQQRDRCRGRQASLACYAGPWRSIRCKRGLCMWLWAVAEGYLGTQTCLRVDMGGLASIQFGTCWLRSGVDCMKAGAGARWSWSWRWSVNTVGRYEM